jgi:hypothetical protein
MIKKIKIISLTLIFLGTLVLALPVLAADVAECEGVGKVQWLGEATGIKHGLIIPCECLKSPAGDCGLTQALQVIVNLSRLLLALTGSAALLMFIYGGTLWILAAGNQERIQKGKDAMQGAAIGIIIIMGAFLIVNFVIFALLGKEYSEIGGVKLFDQPWFQEQEIDSTSKTSESVMDCVQRCKSTSSNIERCIVEECS